jgi:hypothetical protein
MGNLVAHRYATILAEYQATEVAYSLDRLPHRSQLPAVHLITGCAGETQN